MTCRVMCVIAVCGALGCGRLGYDPRAEATSDGAPTDAGGDATAIPDARGVDDATMDAGSFDLEVSDVWTLGSTGEDRISSATLGPDGNLYLAGAFSATIDFGGGIRTSNGSTDLLAVSFTRDMRYLWDVTGGARGTDHANRIAVSAGGDAFFMGLFEGTVDVGGQMLSAATGDDQFLIAVSPTGSVRWARDYTNSADAIRSGGVVADVGPGVIAAGEFTGSETFDTTTLSSAGAADVWVAGYETGGVERWARSFGGTGNERVEAAASDGAGGVILSGQHEGGADFGVGALAAAGGLDVFILALDATGAPRWSRTLSGAGDERAQNLQVAPSGRIFVTGRFAGDVDVGGGVVVSAGADDSFVSVWEPDGSPAWSRTWGSAGPEELDGIGFDSTGRVYLLGSFSGTIDFGLGPLTSVGGEDIVLLVLSADGDPVFTTRFGGPGDDDSDDVLVDEAAGEVILTGQFPDGVDFGSGALSSAGNTDLYVVRLRLPP